MTALTAVEEARAERVPRENDVEDTGLAMFVAHPAFVLTADGAFIGRVDRSGTFQAPWIRTFGEIMLEELPTCAPWGAEARRVGEAFERKSRKERAKQDVEARRALKA